VREVPVRTARHRSARHVPRVRPGVGRGRVPCVSGGHADQSAAVALAIPAATLRALGSGIEVDDAGAGEAVIRLVAGSDEVRRIAVRSEPDRALGAALELLATATGGHSIDSPT